MTTPSNHTELTLHAQELLRMLNDQPNDWRKSVDLAGPDSWLDELSVLAFAIELMKSREPICLASLSVDGLEGLAIDGFGITWAANAEELERPGCL